MTDGASAGTRPACPPIIHDAATPTKSRNRVPAAQRRPTILTDRRADRASARKINAGRYADSYREYERRTTSKSRKVDRHRKLAKSGYDMIQRESTCHNIRYTAALAQFPSPGSQR